MFLNTFDHYKNVKCGLVYYPSPEGDCKTGDEPLPVSLLLVDVKATVVHAAAEIIVTQTYVNSRKGMVDTFFYFPIHTDDFITGFEVETATGIRKNLIIKEPLSDSENSYVEAVKNHPNRFWIGPDYPKDVYHTRVGELKPGESVVVTIAYVTEVKLNVDKIQLRIPNTSVPQFKHESPEDSESAPVPEKKAAVLELNDDDDIVCIDLEDDGEGAEHKIVEESKPVSVVDEPVIAIIKILAEFIFQGESSIGLLECDSHVPHLAAIDQMPDKENWTMAKIVFEGTSEEIDRDFVVSITPRDPLVPRIYVEETADETVLMATFCPVLPLPVTSNPFFLFAVDSPLEDKTKDMMQRTVKFLLRSLRSKSTFNLIRPWTENLLFSESQSADNGESIRKSSRLISEEAEGENISTSTFLQKVFSHVKTTSAICQIIMILYNTLKSDELETCESLVRESMKSHAFRLFVIGIGDVGHSQLEQLAAAGGGTAVQIPLTENVSVAWQPSVTELMTLANSPSLADAELVWSDWTDRCESRPVESEDDELEIISETVGTADKTPWLQIPQVLDPIFSGTQLVTFGIFTRKLYPKSLDVKGVSYLTDSENMEFNYNVELTESRTYYSGSTEVLTKLAYAKGLRQLEEMMPKLKCPSRKARTDWSKTKDKIMQIATREGIPSRYTYFATVDLETGTEVKGHWTRQTRFTDNISGFPTSTLPGWTSRIPYGSIPRNKLSSIRKLTEPPLTLHPIKIARTEVVETNDLIDLTDE